jgi:hypothetical protein
MLLAPLCCKLSPPTPRTRLSLLISLLLLAVVAIPSHASHAAHAAEIAMIYAALGQNDEAMKRLQKGYDERFNPGVLLRPGFDSLRSDPRFLALSHRVGL